MKVGILTHPLIGNYGGILQALAMKQTLESLGHEVYVLDRRHNLTPLTITIKSLFKLIGLRRFSNPFHQYEAQQSFISKRFNKTKELHSHKSLVRAIKELKLDFVLIGSDQVWNLTYTRNSGLDYWGEFIQDLPINAFSYAASMGASEWDITPFTTERIKSYLNKFSGISVRELQAKEILEQKLGLTNVQWVLDPTMLQTTDFYDQYASQRIIPEPYVFVYWLGNEALIPALKGMYPGRKVVKCKLGNPQLNLSVENWLSAIKYADAVVTDSFHGCAISIIYGKHFVPYINKLGGAGRLTSLFSVCGLEYKSQDTNALEDYNQVRININKARQSSLQFLTDCLSAK